ncbi:MAG: hypothetical protein IKO57_01075 [Treponema sp.]|nr:hypothetical protein [Treponema sp.]MBR4629023.1 hypothetical protein [Treponema sp.]MBR6913133.1 hypothetical protein [Treponema sp.]MCR5124432.1 hypothetical protein [Treponema sp.]
MITSFFPGRVRLRAPIFKESDLVEKARSILQRCDAVNHIENNLLTGSVLIEYSPSKVPMQKLTSMQDFFTALAKEAQHFDGTNRQKILSMLDELEGIF